MHRPEPSALAGADAAHLLPLVTVALPQPVAVVAGPGLRVVASNPAWQRLADATGATTLDALFPRAVPAAEAALGAGASSLSLRGLPAASAEGDAGTWWDIDFALHPETADALVVSARDVTEEILARRDGEGAREALASVAARLGLAQEATGVATWEWDAATDRLSWSPGQFRLHGMDPAEDLPPDFAGWIAMAHPDDRALLQALAGGGPGEGGDHQFEFRVRRADTGEERWLLARGRVTRRGAGGMPARLVGVCLDVTERRREAEALREREERLRLAFSAARIFAWDWDVPTGRVAWSEGAEAILGMPPGSFAGTVEAFAALVHPDDSMRVQAALGRALAGEDPEYNVEFRMRRGDGGWRWTATRAVVLRDPAGQPVRVVGVDHDVTALRIAEEAAEARAAAVAAEAGKDWLQLALTAGGMAAWEWDIATGAVRWDTLMERLTGLTPETGGGAAFLARMHPEDRPRVDAAIGAAIEAGIGGSYEAEFRFLRGDGSWRWFGGRGQVVAGPRGATLRLIGVNWDITARREAETALRESEARFRALVDAMPQIAFSAPPHGRTDFVNVRWLEYSGQTEDSALDGGWAAALHPDDAADAVARWRNAVESGEPCEYEQRLRGADGIYRWFLTRAAPLRDGDGRLLRWFGTCTDISVIAGAREAAARSAGEMERLVAERTRALADTARELQAEMQRRETTQAALLQAQKLEALGQLTSGVAHDFNNLLAAVQGSFRLLRRELGTTNERAADLIRHGEHASERGARLIAQLTSFARREDPRPAVLRPAGVLDGARDLITHTAGRTVRCVFDADPDAWPVLVDPLRLETTLLNLTANARDAMPLGGEMRIAAGNADPSEVPPQLPRGREFVRIAVTDAGAGMDAETLRRATEPFFTTKPRGTGTGLGLASAQAFCAASDGALRIRSNPGQGTVVELFLPRASVLPSAEGTVPPDEARHGDATILLADDDDALRPVTAGLLRDLGYAVIEAPSAEAALALAHASEASIDMLVTDIVMGGSPGTVLAARMRAGRAGLPVLYVTGHARATALDGAEAVLCKPFAESDLARAVLRGLGRLPPDPPRPEAPGAGRLPARLRRPQLRLAFERWQAARGLAAGALPTPGQVAADGLPAEFVDFAYLVEVLPAAEPADIGTAGFRFIHAGRVLEDRYGGRLGGRIAGVEAPGDAGPGDPGLGDVLGGSLGAAYRRCVRGRAPLHDYARFDLGDAAPLMTERLVLPLSADGVSVTHLLGIAMAEPGGAPPWPAPQPDGTDGLPGFGAPRLADAVERLPGPLVDALPFGAIRLDPSGVVRLHSARERRLSGLRREAVGRDFFAEIAPCLDNPDFRGRIDRARAARELDVAFGYLSDMPSGAQDVELHVRVQSASDGGTWIFLLRAA